jgi:hypothetical protein
MWLVAAEAAEDVCAAATWRERHALVGDWIAEAADAAGIGANMLRRWMAARRFLVEWDASHPESDTLTLAEQGKIAPAAAEILKRMAEVAPAEIVPVIDGFAGSGMTIRDLRQTYTSALGKAAETIRSVVSNPPYASATGTGRRTAHKLGSELVRQRTTGASKLLFSLANEHLEDLSGNADRTALFYGRYKFRFITPDAVAVCRQDYGIAHLDGYAFKALEKVPAREAYGRLLAEIQFAATFFRRYWLLIHSPRAVAQEIADVIRRLEVGSVGVAVADPQAKALLDIVLRPIAPPSPNRQDEAKEEVLRQGIGGLR